MPNRTLTLTLNKGRRACYPNCFNGSYCVNDTHFANGTSTPVFPSSDLPTDPMWLNVSSAVSTVVSMCPDTGKSTFTQFRVVVAPPSYLAKLRDALSNAAPHVRVVDAFTFSYLARISLGGSNDYRIPYKDPKP